CRSFLHLVKNLDRLFADRTTRVVQVCTLKAVCLLIAIYRRQIPPSGTSTWTEWQPVWHF
ncbi:hypothetical protein T265_09365, partial [Opisthorchis viverrini]